MNARRFDALARTMSAPRSRRLVAHGLLGAAGAVFLGRGLGAAQQATSTAATPATGQLQTRRNAKDLSAGERAAFVDAVRALKQKPSPWAAGISVYDTFVLWHRDAFDCGLMAAHMGPAFLLWHCHFLRLFE